MELDFQYMNFNQKMLSNNYTIRMTPLYHFILSRIAFKKSNGFIASKLRNKIIEISGGEDIYAKDYSFDETDYIYLSKTDIQKEDIEIRDETIYINREVGESLEDKKLKKGDIIITRSGTVGITVLITDKNLPKNKIVLPSGYVKVLTIDEKNTLLEFVTSYLNSPPMRELMEVSATGKNQKNLSHGSVLELPIPEITKGKQLQIMRKIEKIKDKMSGLKNGIKTTTEIIDNVFSKYLKINNNIKEKYYENKLSLQNLKQDRYIRTDPDYFYFYEIYENFIKENEKIKFIELRDRLNFYESGSPIDKKDYVNAPTDYIHLVPRDVKDCKLNPTEPIYLNYQKGEELKDNRCEKGDILLVLSSNVGDCTIFNFNKEEHYTLSHYMARLRINEEEINSKFLVYYLNTSPLKSYFRAIETGKTQKNLAQYNIYHLKVPLLTDYKNIVKEIDENLQKNAETKKEFKKLRENIDKVMWGELHKISEKQRKSF